jgi:hypothetical protein
MPVTFSIDHETKTIISTASGLLSCDELLGHLAAKKTKNVLSYAEVFDVRGVTLDLSISDLHKLAAEVRVAMGIEKPGRIGVVTNSSFIRGLAHTYAALTVSENPKFGVFHDFDEARGWTFAHEN